MGSGGRRRVTKIVVTSMAVAGAMVAGNTVLAGDSEDRSANAATMPKCGGAEELDFGCWERRYIQFTRTFGARRALKDLARQRERHGYVRSACHQLTHRIGRVAGRAEGIDAVGKGIHICSAGYYHGISEAIMGGIGHERIRAEADTVCAKLRRRERYSFDHYNCSHGMGHGFMELYASNVFKSVEGCDALTDRWEAHNCYGGVFMENLSALDNKKRPPDVRPRQPLYPCTAVGRRYKSQCYNQQVTYAVVLNDSDFGAVFRLCDRTERDFRTACYKGLGGNVAIQSSKLIRSPQAKTTMLRRLCGLGRDLQARTGCVVGAVRIMLRDVADGERRVHNFCKSYDDANEWRMLAICVRAQRHAYKQLPLLNRSFVCNLHMPSAARLREVEVR